MPPAAHQVVKRRRTWRQRVLLGVGMAAVLLCVSSAAGLAYYWQLYGHVTRYDVELSRVAQGKPQNYLIVGSDSRENIDPNDPNAKGIIGNEHIGGKRSDTIMILRVDPRSKRAAILSLPRDLWVPIAGTSHSSKINSAYGRGRQVLIDTIRQNFDIDIHHYVEVDFSGFRALVKAIGGVTLWFDTPVRDKHVGLDVPKTGCVTLDPQMALNFARSRYFQYKSADGTWRSDPTSDLGRITRQQIFIRRSVKQAKSKGTSNPVTLNRLVNVAIDNVGLDPGLGVRDIISLARRFADFNEDSLKTYALPVVSGGGPGAVRISNQRTAEGIFNLFRGLAPGEIPPRLIDVEVLNGTGAPNQAGDVAAALQTIGFGIRRIGDSPNQPVTKTTVLYAPGDEASGIRVARHISGSVVLAPANFLNAGQVVVTTGLDFTKIHRDPASIASVKPPSSPTTATTKATTSTSASPATTTTVAGHAVGDPPAGQAC